MRIVERLALIPGGTQGAMYIEEHAAEQRDLYATLVMVNATCAQLALP